uniref:Uncharacterized protein n=1 Tax=Cacopsylla melanoneura TaxID=428564 RepID=A0A8D9AYT2_9HEMI
MVGTPGVVDSPMTVKVWKLQRTLFTLELNSQALGYFISRVNTHMLRVKRQRLKYLRLLKTLKWLIWRFGKNFSTLLSWLLHSFVQRCGRGGMSKTWKECNLSSINLFCT